MIFADQLADAARVAAKAAHPTDILLITGGFRVVAIEGGLQSAKFVKYSELEDCGLNPLVAAVRFVNERLR